MGIVTDAMNANAAAAGREHADAQQIRRHMAAHPTGDAQFDRMTELGAEMAVLCERMIGERNALSEALRKVVYAEADSDIQSAAIDDGYELLDKLGLLK